MRNNAVHSRQIFTEQRVDSEHVLLMHRGSDPDIESGVRIESQAPPPWADCLEEVQYIITRLRTKISELKSRHEKQILRPTLDDSAEEEHIIRLTNDIGRQFNHAYRNVTQIKAQMRHGSKSEQRLAKNVVIALVTILQDLSLTFRNGQSKYLKSITSREERSNAFFELPNFEELSLDNETQSFQQSDLLLNLPTTSSTSTTAFVHNEDTPVAQLTQQQLLLIQEDNTKMVAEREEEVNKIVRSIVDLNEVFKDVAHMVHEQGTVLDRIDYNIEQTQVQVSEGYKQLQKADRYQQSNRKMHCVLLLSVTVILLIMLLIIVKS